MYDLVYLCRSLLEQQIELVLILIMNANSHFGTLRYSLTINAVLFTYVAHFLNDK